MDNSEVAAPEAAAEAEQSEVLSATELDAPSNEMPLPQDPRVVFQGGLFVLALLASAYFAKEVLLPIILAFILKLLLQPVMRWLARLRLPRVFASLLVIAALFAVIVGLGELLSTPRLIGPTSYRRVCRDCRSA